VLTQSNLMTNRDRKASNLLRSQVLRSSPQTTPEMTSPQHHQLDQESADERLPSRWSSSSRVIVDAPPSQPARRQEMGESTCCGSVKETSHHKDILGTRNFRRGSAAIGSLQRSNSRWTSGSTGVIADSPPLQPLRRRPGSPAPVGILQQSGSRWSSGSQATILDTASTQTLARSPKIVRLSSVSALKHSAVMKNLGSDIIFETTSRSHCILNRPRINPSLRCITSRSA
jgi:hypothetical protein